MVISQKIEEYSTERPHYTPGKSLWLNNIVTFHYFLKLHFLKKKAYNVPKLKKNSSIKIFLNT